MADAEDKNQSNEGSEGKKAPAKKGPAKGGLSMKQISERQDASDQKMDTVLNLLTGIVEKLEPADAPAPEDVITYEMTEEDIADEQAALSPDAKNNPSILNNYLESEEQETGGAEDAELAEAPDGTQFMSQSQYGDTTSPEFKNWVSNMAHAHEKVSIFVQSTNEKDADTVIEIKVNGRSMLFERNKQYNGVPRYFLEGFLRAKPVQYDNDEYKDEKGLQQYKYKANRGLRYAVALVNPTARDTAWFQNIQAQI